MSEFIGVKSHFEVKHAFSSLKRDALIFHRIAIPDCSYLWFNRNLTAKFPKLNIDLPEDFDWLFQAGVIFDPIEVLDGSFPVANDRADMVREMLDLADALNCAAEDLIKAKESVKLRDRILNNRFRDLVVDKEKELIRKSHENRNPFGVRADMTVGELVRNVETYLGEEIRQISLQLRSRPNISAFPILSFMSDSTTPEDADKSNVIQIVLESLPVPDDSVPWEHILEYRNDPDSVGKFLALRNWINEIARARLSPVEVEEKLEYLISDYKRHLQLHKMKTTAGTIETVVVSSVEFLEDLVKFKWGKLAKSLFSMRHKRIALMEGELTVPGNEISYIVKAKETFTT